MQPKSSVMSKNADITSRVETKIKFAALDGMSLGGYYFENTTEQDPIALAALVICGMGIPAIKYRRFARYLATSGIPTLTFDYRGIGDSRPDNLRGFTANVADWSEYDCGGAIAWLRARYPKAQIVAIAHSIGSLLFGGSPNAGLITRCVLICAHTGYFGDYRRPYRIPMALLWHGIMPVLTRTIGYFPGRRLGLGEDIPAAVALEWAARRKPMLRKQETERNLTLINRCAALKMPALVVSVTDDAFSTDAGTRRVLAYFPGLSVERLCVRPQEIGQRKMGHFGFFRRASRHQLWPKILAYLVH